MNKTQIFIIFLLCGICIGLIVPGTMLLKKENKYVFPTTMTSIVSVPNGKNTWIYSGTITLLDGKTICKDIPLKGTGNIGGSNVPSYTVYVNSLTDCPTEAHISSDDFKPVGIALISIGSIFGFGAIAGLLMNHKFSKSLRSGIQMSNLFGKKK